MGMREENRELPRFLLAAPASGSGKTIVTCAILQAFQNRGLKPASFKCGPDYIDPMFHRTVIGASAGNLDLFFAGADQINALLADAPEDTGVAVLEGVMGYYDGLGGKTAEASTYETARLTQTPAVLVADVSGMSMSVLAVIQGFLEYKKDSQIAGVIFNRLAPALYPDLKERLEEELGIPSYGYLPKLSSGMLESRHLGLAFPEDQKGIKEQMQQLSGQAEKTIDLDGLLRLSKQAEKLHFSLTDIPKLEGKLCIAVARDEAFSFYYAENLRLMEQMGAELVFFSPLRDQKLPDADALLLGGGYPELYAGQLEKNRTMRESIRTAVKGGLFCIAECGGFLYLHESLTDGEGKEYQMCGVIKERAYPVKRLNRFGYINVKTNTESPFGKAGTVLKAHEFHYWESTNPGCQAQAGKPIGNRGWECMHLTENLAAGFPHFYAYGNREAFFEWMKRAYGAAQKRKNQKKNS